MAPRMPLSRHNTNQREPPKQPPSINPSPQQNTSCPSSTSSKSPTLTRRSNPPTTNDPTLKPPWKKQKLHKNPPANWAVLWPRPPTWWCPPEASKATLYDGCKYIDPPEVFDPEIEHLPDWIDAKDRDQRLWSGVDRVVVVKGQKEEEEEGTGVVRRGADEEARDEVEDEDGSDDDDKNSHRRKEGEPEIRRKAVFYIPHEQQPQHRHSLSRIEQHATTTSMLPTPTLDLGLTSILAVPRPGETHSVKGHHISNVLMGFILPVAVVMSFVALVMIYFCVKLVRMRKRAGRVREEARARFRIRRGQELESVESSDFVGLRLIANTDAWQDIPLR